MREEDPPKGLSRQSQVLDFLCCYLIRIFMLQACSTHYVSYARLEQIRKINIPILVVTASADA
jgi:hypothetical protein